MHSGLVTVGWSLLVAIRCGSQSPPHGVGDTDGGTEEGGEAEQRDEDGGHLADSVRLAGRLAVVHDAAL